MGEGCLWWSEEGGRYEGWLYGGCESWTGAITGAITGAMMGAGGAAVLRGCVWVARRCGMGVRVGVGVWDGSGSAGWEWECGMISTDPINTDQLH